MLITSGRLRVWNDAGWKLAEVKTPIVGAYLGDWQSDYLPMLRGWWRFVQSAGLRTDQTLGLQTKRAGLRHWCIVMTGFVVVFVFM